MKTIDNKIIIYDSACPMCSLYTRAFIRMGMLSDQGRIAFSDLSDSKIISQLDLARAAQEIPLIDTKGEGTLYGLDSLAYVLGQKLPFISRIMRITFVSWFFRRLYKMVSFNRRVIIPAKPSRNGVDCTPPFNMKYRITFIVFAVLLSSLITFLFGRSVAPYISVDQFNGGWQMLLVAGTGWIVQMIIVMLFKAKDKVDYLGHLSTVMILGVLMLLPGIALSSFTGYQYWLIPVVSVLLSSGIMLWQHMIRVSHIGAAQVWTLCWFLSLQVTAFFWAYIFYLKNIL